MTYGMTETASQVATTDRLTGDVRDPACVGHPIPGIEVDASETSFPPRPLRIRGPMVMAGYANPGRVPGRGLEHGWFKAADLGWLSPDGRLQVLGRADDVLVIGGTNVSRRKIEAVLLEAPDIGEVVVVDLPDPVWGRRLVAAFTGAVGRATLAAWCLDHLSGPERPRDFRRIDPLPLLDSGKYDRLQVAALAAEVGGEAD